MEHQDGSFKTDFQSVVGNKGKAGNAFRARNALAPDCGPSVRGSSGLLPYPCCRPNRRFPCTEYPHPSC